MYTSLYIISRSSSLAPLPPTRSMSYGAASNWVSMQAPGVQMYYSIDRELII